MERGQTTDSDPQSATIANQLASEIRRRRLEAGLSQRVLATRIGYSRQYVSMTEWHDANLPSHELITAIDTALNAGGELIALRKKAKPARTTSRRSCRESQQSLGDSSSASECELGRYHSRAPELSDRPSSPQLGTALLWGVDGEEEDEVQRRELVRAITALTALSPGIAAAIGDSSEIERTAQVTYSAGRVDPATLDNITAILNHARLQDDQLGPRAAIRTVLAQAELTSQLAANTPAALQPQLASLRSRINASAGWQLFDLGYPAAAATFLQTACTIADEAGDYSAAASAFAEYSGMTEEVGSPLIAADQATAAQTRAAACSDPRLRAHTAGIAALAFSRVGFADKARENLHKAAAFDVTTSCRPEESPAYFVTPGHIARMRAKTLHILGDLPAAAQAAGESIALHAVRDRAASHVLLGTIHLDAGNLDAAVEFLIAGAETHTTNPSARVQDQLTQARRTLWTKAPNSTAAKKFENQITELQQ